MRFTIPLVVFLAGLALVGSYFWQMFLSGEAIATETVFEAVEGSKKRKRRKHRDDPNSYKAVSLSLSPEQSPVALVYWLGYRKADGIGRSSHFRATVTDESGAVVSETVLKLETEAKKVGTIRFGSDETSSIQPAGVVDVDRPGSYLARIVPLKNPGGVDLLEVELRARANVARPAMWRIIVGFVLGFAGGIAGMVMMIVGGRASSRAASKTR